MLCKAYSSWLLRYAYSVSAETLGASVESSLKRLLPLSSVPAMVFLEAITSTKVTPVRHVETITVSVLFPASNASQISRCTTITLREFEANREYHQSTTGMSLAFDSRNSKLCMTCRRTRQYPIMIWMCSSNIASTLSTTPKAQTRISSRSPLPASQSPTQHIPLSQR